MSETKTATALESAREALASAGYRLARDGETVAIERGRWERVLAVAKPAPIWISAGDESSEYWQAEDRMIRAAMALEPGDLDDPGADGGAP